MFRQCVFTAICMMFHYTSTELVSFCCTFDIELKIHINIIIKKLIL